MGSPPRVLPQRIGIIGDVHTESATLGRVLSLLQRLNANQLLCVGDIADGPEEMTGVERCRELLVSHGVLTVCGNHDRWLLEGTMRDLNDAIERHELEPETLAYLEDLPATIEFETPAGMLLLCHGLGSDDMGLLGLHDSDRDMRSNAPLQQILRQQRYRFVIHGHSHKRAVKALDGTLFINVGTLHRAFDPCVGLVDFQAGTVEFYNAGDSEDAQLNDRVTFAQSLGRP